MLWRVAVFAAQWMVVCSRADTNRAVSRHECVVSALEKNFGMTMARHDFAAAEFNVRAAVGSQYDPVFSSSVGRTFLDSPTDADPKKSGLDANYQQTLDTVQMGLSGNLTPGLSLNLGVQSTFDSIITPELPPFPRTTNNFQSAVLLTMRQSLLKNFWIDQGRTQIAVSKKDLKISELDLRGQMMGLAGTVAGAYYDLLYAEDNLRVQQKALEFADEMVKTDRRRVEAGSVPELEAALSESHQASARANVAAAEETIAAASNALRTLIANNLVDSADENLQATDPLEVVQQNPDRSSLYQRALLQRPDVLEAREHVERQGLIVRFNNNQRFPRLDIVGSFGGAAVEPGWGDSVHSVENLEHPQYGVGFVFSMPLGNVAARNRYKASLAAKDKAVVLLRQTEQKAWVDIDNVIKALPAIQHRIDATHQAEVFADLALASERRKLAAGASTSFLVLQAEKNLVAAQTSSLRAQVDYVKALVRLALSDGSILDQYQVALKIN